LDMARRYSPSPSTRLRRKSPHDDDGRAEATRECALPGLVPPATAVRAQVFASQQAFTATHQGSVISICGNCTAERHNDGTYEVLRVGVRARPLQCCALSPCGRYLAAGESGPGRNPSVLVYDRYSQGSVLPTSLRGHHYGVRLLAWAPQSLFLVSIGDSETEKSDHQMILWSWPKGERLAAALVSHGAMDISFSPNYNDFVVVSQTIAKRWSIKEPPPSVASLRCKGPPQLIGHTVPPSALGLGKSSDRQSGRRSIDDSLVSGAWGDDSALFVLSRRGRITSLIGNEADRWVDLNQRSFTLVWTPSLCDCIGVDSPPMGVLICGIAGGTVQLLDAGSLKPISALPNAAKGGATDAVGVSVSLDGEALWVLYADRSLARWRCLQGVSDCVLPAPVPGLRDVQAVPRSPAPQVMTCTDRGLQLWTETPAGLTMESRTEPGTSRTGELTALACSSWAVACGHRGGEIHLHAIPSLSALDPIPVRHSGDVLALAFSATPSSPGGPLLLASGARDRTAMVFRIDVKRRTSSGGVLSSRVTLLLQLPNHTAALQHVGLSGSAEALDAQLAVCTADKLLLMRDLELGQTTATVRRSHKHLGKSTRWVGLCVHPSRPVFFAACGDRRLLEIDSVSRTQQSIRVGGPEVELVAPLRSCADGKLLAIAFSGTGAYAAIEPGVLLVDAESGLKLLARFTGHAEVASGFAFLGNEHLLACWADGAMLGWDAVDPQTVSSHDGQRLQCPAQSPPAHRGTVTPLRTRSPIRGRALYNRGCESAPADRRKYPEGLLEQLMATSPKPPKWAAKSREPSLCEDCEETSSTDMGNPKPYVLGKWARGSKVGAQVRSAADLCRDLNMSSNSHAAYPASMPHGGFREASRRGSEASRGSAGSARTLGGNIRSASEDCGPTRSCGQTGSCPDLRNVAFGAGGVAEGEQRSASEERRVLQPLPPKPRFPPPEYDEAMQKPFQSARSIAAEYENRIRNRIRIPISHMQTHASQNIAQAKLDTENVPPRSSLEKPTNVDEFRAKVSILSSEAMNGPVRSQLGPEATEVGALLRRVETLLSGMNSSRDCE
jgi:WD40 repeat protein